MCAAGLLAAASLESHPSLATITSQLVLQALSLAINMTRLSICIHMSPYPLQGVADILSVCLSDMSVLLLLHTLICCCWQVLPLLVLVSQFASLMCLYCIIGPAAWHGLAGPTEHDTAGLHVVSVLQGGHLLLLACTTNCT